MIVKLLLFIFSILNIALVYLFGEEFINGKINTLYVDYQIEVPFLGFILDTKYLYLILIFLLELYIILYTIKAHYDDPILELKYNIQKFLVGKTKNEKIKFRKTKNKNLNFIITFFSDTLNSLKNIKEEFIRGKEIKGEVELGKEIQGKIFEKKLTEVPSLNIVARAKPAGEIGGDSYDIIKQDDNYYIYVGDATGHGVGAGFIMVMVNALVSGFSKVFKSGSDILTKTNEILKPRVKANLLMSMLMIRWDEKEKRMYMTGAGHEYLLIYKHDKKRCYKIKSGGVALGMTKDTKDLLKEKEISFEPNDIIVLYSDGITEAINKPRRDGTEERFGEDRLVEAIEKAPNMKGKKFKSATSVFNNITINLSSFMGYKYLKLDDITLCVVHYKDSEYNKYEDYSLEIADEFITEWKW
ncbi:MAG: PP2C family protein-serine/threonine phosphatase [Candidatus Gracilibacteria bacterium]|nr:PP2C family protein-serine/threonine phosphatase [Candidatus Gracilibacteria bacterium]